MLPLQPLWVQRRAHARICVNPPTRPNIGPITEAHRTNIVSHHTLYILCIYPVILKLSKKDQVK